MSESFQRRSPVRFYNWISIYLLVAFLSSVKCKNHKKMFHTEALAHAKCVLYFIYTATHAINLFAIRPCRIIYFDTVFFSLSPLVTFALPNHRRTMTFVRFGRCLRLGLCNWILLHNFKATDSCHSISYISSSPDSWRSHFLVFTCIRPVFLSPHFLLLTHIFYSYPCLRMPKKCYKMFANNWTKRARKISTGFPRGESLSIIAIWFYPTGRKRTKHTSACLSSNCQISICKWYRHWLIRELKWDHYYVKI